MTIEKPLYEVKAKFSNYLEYVEQGNTVIITKHGVPHGELKAFGKNEPKKKFGWGRIAEGYNEPGIEFAPLYTDEELESFAYNENILKLDLSNTLS